MTTDHAWLGLDLGTSSLKALLLDGSGHTLGVASASYPLHAPRPDQAESDPGDWWAAAVRATAEVLEASGRPTVAGIGLSGQMHGQVVIDACGEPRRPAIVWSDGRAAPVADRYARLTADQRRRLANPFMPGAAGPTLCWLAEHEPDVLAGARWALQPKDWLRTRLVDGPPVTDASDASATLLWDVPADTWASDIAAELGIAGDLLPPVEPSGAPAGGLSVRAASELGLRAGIPVAVGAGDAAAASVGTGLVRPGRVQLTVGTGAQIVLPRADPAVDPTGRTHLYRAAIEGQWYGMAAVQNAGLALDWVRRLMGVEWPVLFAAAPDGPPRLDDPLFVPNVTRERPFQPCPGPGAAFVGARLGHASTDLLRVALEGVVLGIRLAFEALPDAATTGSLLLAGGGAMIAAYRQLLADVLGRDLESVETGAASARGAALLGGVAAGHWASVEAAAISAAPNAAGPVTRSRPAIHRAYGARFEAWQAAACKVGSSISG